MVSFLCDLCVHLPVGVRVPPAYASTTDDPNPSVQVQREVSLRSYQCPCEMARRCRAELLRLLVRTGGLQLQMPCFPPIRFASIFNQSRMQPLIRVASLYSDQAPFPASTGIASVMKVGQTLAGTKWDYRLNTPLNEGVHESTVFKAEILPKDGAISPTRWSAISHQAAARFEANFCLGLSSKRSH